MRNLFDDNEIVTTRDRINSLPLVLDPNTQDKLDSLPVENSYQNESESFQDVGPYKVDIKKPVPSFEETLVHSMPFIRSLHNGPDLNPLSDYTPDGWNAASDPNNFIGVQEKNHGYIAAASSPNDAYFRRLDALKKQEEDEYFENGNMMAKFMGGFIDSLPFAILPLGQAAKYATLSRSVFESSMAALPGLAVGSLLHEGSVQASEIGGNIEDTLINAYVDTLAGLAFVGAGAGLGKGFDALKLYDATKFMKYSFSGINAEINISKEGKMLGYVAVPGPGLSVGAAEVTNAQAFLDSTFAKNGLFAVPKLGGLLEKGVSLANPIIRGLTSPFETIRGFTDRASSHSIITEGIKAGRAKPEDFETLMGIVMGENKQYYRTMKVLLDRRNDIDSKSSVVNLVERTRKRWKDEGYINEEKFGNEIKEAILSGSTHEHGAVNEAAAITRQMLDDTWELYREVFNLPKEWMPPPTSDGYFPRVYNLSLMIERPKAWQDMWVGWWKQADQDINTAMKPINDFKEHLKSVKATHAELNTPESAKELKAATRKLRKMKEDLADKIKSDKEFFLHGEDHAGLSGEESRQLKKIFKPLRKAKKELNVQKKIVEKLKQDKFFAESKVTDKEKMTKLNSEVEKEKAELKKRQDAHDIEEEKLQQMASENKISPRFYDRIPDSQRVKFKNANNLMKFRKTFESEFHMQQHADALRDTVLNQTPEDTLNQVLGHYIGNASETHTMKRTQMIPDTILQSNNFLSNNLPLVMSNYRNALHRKISMKTVFNDVTIDGGIAPIVEKLTAEFKAKEKAIIDNIKLKEGDREKQLKKLNKEFVSAKEFMQLSHARMMGRTRGGKKMNAFIRAMRLWTVSTRLGSVPLTMITDLTANIYKHGFWPSIRDGLIPALENINHQIKTGKGGAYIENASHAHLGLSTTLAANNDRDWGGIAMEHVPLTGKLGNFMETAAHMSGNFALTNQAQNNLERIAAGIIQSKIIRYLIAHQKGEIAEKDLQKLLVYGLDPKEWGERFLKSYKAKGHEGTLKDSHQSNYWQWDDVEAANKMSRTIYKGVRDTIVSKGMMDAPFFFDDPVWGTLVFFHGWSTAALTRYLVPLMQRPDAEHLTGLVWMLAAGSMVSPLRKISKGETPFDEESNMFIDALTDSGVLTPIMNLVEDANILTNHRVLGNFVNDRWKGRSFASALGGPVVGVGEDVTKILGMLGSGRLNETDVKKAGRLIPGMQPWFLKGFQNKMIESLGLPKTASDADNSQANAYR